MDNPPTTDDACAVLRTWILAQLPQPPDETAQVIAETVLTTLASVLPHTLRAIHRAATTAAT